MKPSMTSILLLLAGLILAGIGIASLVTAPGDNAIVIGDKPDNSSGYYLFFGILLSAAGILRLMRQRRR